MIKTYVCEKPCDSIMLKGKKLLTIENPEYVIVSVTGDDTDYGYGMTWLNITLRKMEDET